MAAPPRSVAEVLHLRPTSFLEPFAPWFLEHYPYWGAVRQLVRDGLTVDADEPLVHAADDPVDAVGAAARRPGAAR